MAQGNSSIRSKTYDIAIKLSKISSLKKSYRDLQNYFKIKNGISIKLGSIKNEEAQDFVQLEPIVNLKKWKKTKVHPFKIHKLFLKEWK